ncbi:MAG: sulfate adenylyltransferase subunit CysD [Candidatus Melainabacteria bacterium HGW-Melainabacteria-1]|nr:MAG: sulfate adenylyltransferase subunit CysD [Candidatus Melainabacteria bacterium HGW-Melainabacteria-1]
MSAYRLSHLQELEAESIHIIREVVAEFKNPVMLYSVGKDSSVMVRLAQKAFRPAPLPFPLMHIDTGYKFPEMYTFRDQFTAEINARLIVESNTDWIAKGAHPSRLGSDTCCSLLKTRGLLDALNKHGFDAAFGGARREEEKSRAKERVFSVRDELGQWDPKNQRPELWDLYNCRVRPGESVRVFPLSNWTELDIWEYIQREQIPVVDLYFARKRKVIAQGNLLIPYASYDVVDPDHKQPVDVDLLPEVWCRYRSLGCIPCTGAIRSRASNVDEIMRELVETKRSERENRLIDLTSDASMEQKKREGYF